MPWERFYFQYGKATRDCNTRMDMYAWWWDYGLTFKFQLLLRTPVRRLGETPLNGIFMREHYSLRDVKKIHDLADSLEMFLEEKGIVHDRISIYR